MILFYSPCSPTQSNNSEPNYIHPDRGQETHTHSKTWPTYTHPSLCVFVCVKLCASLGRTVSPELLHWHIFSSIHYPHRQTRPAVCVCVCVCVEAYRACFAGGEGREVSSGGNKSICWLLTEWEIKTSQWSIFITSLPLSFIRTRICFSRSHAIQPSLSFSSAAWL